LIYEGKFMAMTKNKIAVVFTLIVIGLGAAFVLQDRAMTKLRDENGILHEQVQQSAGLAEENQRLSNLVAQARQNQPMSEEQFQELLRLRGEVGVLRKQKDEVEKLRAESRQLHAAQNSHPPTPSQTAPDYFPKESWSFAGYANPEDTFQTFSWALQQGDVKTLLDSLSPEKRAEMAKEFAEKPETTIAQELIQSTRRHKGFRILEKQMVSEDESVLTVYVYAEGRNSVMKLAFKRFGNEWKYDLSH
jgi:hypothetical protein